MKKHIGPVAIVLIVVLMAAVLFKREAIAPVKEVSPAPVTTVNTETVSSPCPFAYAENLSLLELTDCVRDESDSGDDAFVARREVLTSAFGIADEFRYPIRFLKDGPPARMMETLDFGVFVDAGTSHVRTLSVFEPSAKATQLTYLSGADLPVITRNGYLVYEAPSVAFPNRYPDREVSAAVDVHALRLSDLKDSVLYAATADTDYRIYQTEEEQKTLKDGEFLLQSDADRIFVARIHGAVQDIVKVDIESLNR